MSIMSEIERLKSILVAQQQEQQKKQLEQQMS